MPYLTPSDDSVNTTCISITVPDLLDWRSVVIGQLQELFMLHNWDEYGLTKQETVDRLLELNPDFQMGGCNGMSCQDVADCIDNDAVVQNSINTTIINSGKVDPNTIDPENTTGNDRFPEASTESVSPEPPSCDYDAIWAGIRYMVERIDGEGRDLLEDLTLYNDQAQQVAELIDLVPLLGDTIKDISDLFTEQLPDILDAYNAASSPTFLDQVACDIFQIICGECRYPTFDEMMNYFFNNSYAAIPQFSQLVYADLWDVIKGVTIGVPQALWYTINSWQLATMSFGGKWNGTWGKKTIAIWCSLGEDNPNDNWTVLCDPCLPPFEIFLDFAVTGQFDPPLGIASGDWDATNLWYSAGSNGNLRQVSLNLTNVCDTVFFTYGRLQGQIQDNNFGQYAKMFGVQVAVGGIGAVDVEIDQQYSSVANMQLVVSTNKLTHFGHGYITTLRFRGVGFVNAAYVPYMVYGTPSGH